MKIKLFIIIFPFILLISACSSANKASPAQVPTSTPRVESTTPPTSIAAATATPTPTIPPAPTATQSPQIVPTTVLPSPTPMASPTPSLSPTPEASPTALPPATQAAQAVASSGCTDIANFVDDVTVPDGTSFRMGDTFTKTWKVRNDGTCTWDSKYALVSAGGVVMNAPLSNPLPNIPPGTTADISIDMTAPSRGGVYQSNWEFQDPSGARFGVGPGGNGLLWAQIAVSFVDPTATQAAIASSTSATPSAPTSTSPSASNPTTQGACTATRDTSVEAQVLALINQARTSQGLNALQSQDQLTAAALAHSMDMACNNFVDHVGSDGTLWYDRVKAQGYANYNSSRENIYVGHPEFGGNAQGAFTWWWNSKIHHDNMLNPDVSQIGVAYVFDPNSQYGGYYTTVFARP